MAKNGSKVVILAEVIDGRDSGALVLVTTTGQNVVVSQATLDQSGSMDHDVVGWVEAALHKAAQRADQDERSRPRADEVQAP